jgi:quercetin dioxygenase-like cupin family protein
LKNGFGKAMRSAGVVGIGALLMGQAAWAVDPPAVKLAGKPQPYEQVIAIPIPMVSETKTIVGQDFKFPSGSPLVKAYLIELPAGKDSGLHSHDVPLIGYVVSGTLEVDYGSKGKKILTAGNGFIEAMNWCHVGRPVGDQPVKMIGIYLAQTNPDRSPPNACAKPN